MTKISELPVLTASSVTVPSLVTLPVADAQGTPDTKGLALDALGISAHYRVITSTSHGLTTASNGKPIFRDGATWEVWDDVEVDAFPMWILINVPDGDTLVMAGIGAFVELPVSLLINGSSYDPAVSGYPVYWDRSAGSGSGNYTGTKPGDSQESSDPVLLVTSVGANTFQATVATKVGLSESHVRVVRGTGVAAVDTASFVAAKAAVEALGWGSIGIHGNVILNANQNFTQPISLFGVEGTNGEITLTDNTFLSWNNGYAPISGSTTAIQATAAKQAYIRVPTGTLAAGDWFIAMADDCLSGMTHSNDSLNKNLDGATAAASTDKITYTAHGLLNDGAIMFDSVGATGLTKGATYWVVNKTANDFQIATTRGGSAISIPSDGTVNLRSILANCPAEIHQVKEIRQSSGGFDYILFDDFIVDALTVNPRIAVVSSPTEGVHVKNLRFSWTGTVSPTNSTLAFNKCFHVTVSNCYWEYNGPNEIWAFYCAHVKIVDCTFSNKKGYNGGDGYAVVAGPVNYLLWADSSVMGCRHSFTTSAHTVNGARYGTPRNVVIDNILVRMDGRNDTSLVLFDTHAEGWGIIFQNCIAVMPYDPRNPAEASPVHNTNVGFQSRCRHTIYKGNTIMGSGLNYGIRVMGDDAEIEQCKIEDLWRAIDVFEETTGLTSSANRCKINHNSIRDLNTNAGGAGVILRIGTGHRVAHNDFDDVAGTGSFGGVDPSCVMLFAGATAKIVNNSMNKASNKFSVGGTGFTDADLQLSGNSMLGYTGVAGVSDSGFSTSNPDYVALQVKADTYNWTD